MDYKKLDKLINSRSISDDFYSFDTAYLTTTENIAGYMPGMLDYDVLAVCSSGDHYLNALYQGAKNIDLFDINEFSYAVLNLKIAAIKSLEYEEFLTYFGIINRHKMLGYKLYLKIRENLNLEFRDIFDYIYKSTNNSGLTMIDGTALFYKDQGEQSTALTNCSFLTKSGYIYLNKLLMNVDEKEIKFIHSNIFDISSKLTKKYDAIFLSNISSCYDPKKFLKLIDILQTYLNENGIIYFAYLYKINDKVEKNIQQKLQDIFKDKKIIMENIPSVHRNRNDKACDKVMSIRKY
jgi:hypothetical protein